MRHKLILLSLIVLTVPALGALGQSITSAFAKDVVPPNVKSADIKRERLELHTQTAILTHDRKYPNGGAEKIRATIQYPVVQESVLKDIVDAIDLKQAYGKSLAEIKEEFQEYHWLRKISYVTPYNRNGVLQLTYTIAGLGAYPSQYDKSIAVDLHNGSVITIDMLLPQKNQQKVATIVNTMMQKEIDRTIAEKTKSIDITEPEMREMLQGKQFQVEDLQNFVIGEKGITFIYDFGFPHVSLALEPREAYFVSYAQLKPYLQKQGVGARLLK